MAGEHVVGRALVVFHFQGAGSSCFRSRFFISTDITVQIPLIFWSFETVRDFRRLPPPGVIFHPQRQYKMSGSAPRPPSGGTLVRWFDPRVLTTQQS